MNCCFQIPKIKNIDLVSSTHPGRSLYKTLNKSFTSKAGHNTAVKLESYSASWKSKLSKPRIIWTVCHKINNYNYSW